MKKYLMAGVLVLFYAFTAIPLAAMANETVKIQLPDGVYIYDSEVVKKNDGRTVVGFEQYFVVHNNRIYGSIATYEKYGLPKLNALFGGNKKYKILCGGEIVGTKQNLRFEKEEGADLDDAYIFSDTSYSTREIQQGPAYGSARWGSATMCLAVPEEYKEVKKKVYNTISQEEVEKVTKLAKEKLLPILIRSKEARQYQIKKEEMLNGKINLIDKLSHDNGLFYIGIYWFIFKTPVDSYVYTILFFVEGDQVYLITTNYDAESMGSGMMSIYGMLDVDGDGKEELIVDKLYPSEDGPTVYLEIYKRRSNDEWTRINKILTTRRVD